MSDTQNQEKPSLVKKEEVTLRFWKEKKIFEKSLDKEAPRGDFVFYDGPPFGNGLPHYGHIVPLTLKDAVPRYKTMRGFRVPRRWGWDCHGLPVENFVEKELGLKTKKDIEDYGIEKFNARARESILRFEKEWKEIIPRIGRWADMDNPYKTMDVSFTESIWWVWKTLWDKGLAYEGFKPMHVCPRCETTLANFEVAQGYKDVKDISITVKFELADEPGTYLLAWTTTPWTLPGNSALYVHKDFTYMSVHVAKVNGTHPGIKEGETYIFAATEDADQRILGGPVVHPDGDDTRGTLTLPDASVELDQIRVFKPAELVGRAYKPLFDYFVGFDPKYYHIDYADFVTLDGTGLVHSAIMYGEVDYNRAMEQGLKPNHILGKDGRYLETVPLVAGMFFKDADVPIIVDLAKRGLLYKKEKITHSYPHCWRCDTPLLNYATSSWFIKVSEFRDKLLATNKETRWVPEHVRDGRFGKWLEGARDWGVSRQRYWGAPLPIWRCESCKKVEVIGSIEEMKKRSGGVEPKNAKGELDLHRPFIDAITFACSCGGKMQRIPDVFDCWFESGSMPYGQLHYPFENKEIFDSYFPAEFIAEGMDQTRGWFYSLMVLSTALFGKPAFKNVIVNGQVLAEDGQKISKRLKNYPDLMTEVVNVYGADALRLYLMSSPTVRGEDFCFAKKGVEEVYKKTLQRLDNAVQFYELYADKNQEPETKEPNKSQESKNVLDRWVMALLEKLTREVTEGMERYELDRASRPFAQFVDDLSTWYVRRSRDRAKSDDVADKEAFLTTLRHVLLELSKLMAPFTPFFAEDMYQRAGGSLESVHMESWSDSSSWPGGGEEGVEKILDEMAEIRKIVSLGLELRAKANIKVRQPLSKLTLNTQYSILNKALLSLIKDEVNVKDIVFDDSLTEEVALDTTMTPELREEGRLRELMRALQEMRKDAGLQPSDKITLTFGTDAAGKAFLEKHGDVLKKAVCATSITFGEGGEPLNLEGLTLTTSLKKA